MKTIKLVRGMKIVSMIWNRHPYIERSFEIVNSKLFYCDVDFFCGSFD